jgi:hypothetical protein
MKRNLLIIALILSAFKLLAQENMITLSGGYVFSNIENVDQNATGFRINGLFEFNPNQGMFSHGLSVGYIRTSATNTIGNLTTDYTITNVPIYYAPKVFFGSGSLKGFLKGALGTHTSWYKRTGALGDLESKDWGFYGGASLGGMKSFNEKLFINIEYEWAYLSNAYYRDGFVNSIMAGIGMKF